MIIFAGDLARKTGWAIGEAGAMPQSGSWTLRESHEDPYDEPGRLIARIDKLVAATRPDLIALEAVMSPVAQRSAGAIINQALLHGALHAYAAISRINVVRVHVHVARRTVTGFAMAPKPADRALKQGELSKMTKLMVRDHLVRAGLLPEGCADLDRSDAVLIHAWASQVHGGCLPKLPLLG